MTTVAGMPSICEGSAIMSSLRSSIVASPGWSKRS